MKVSSQIYNDIQKAGIEVLFDDRSSVTPGFKFKDADLLGMPFQIIVGDKGLKDGQVEIKRRKTGKRQMVRVEDVLITVKGLLQE